MTSRPLLRRQTPHAWAKISQVAVDDLYSLQGYENVMLCHFDRDAGISTPVAWAGRSSELSRIVERQATRLFPGYSSPWEVATCWNVNAPMRRLWTTGETVIDSVENLNEGVNAAPLLDLVSRLMGVRHAICVPLRVGEISIGSLCAFQRSETFPAAQIRTTQAFARQVALSIHNVQLLEMQRQTAAALASSVQLLSQAEERAHRTISEFLHSQVQSKLLVAWSRLAEVSVRDEASQRRLDEVRRDLEQLREQDVRLVSHQLHPEALDVGLIPALQVLVSRFRGLLDVSIVANDVLAHLDNTASPRLPQTLRLIVFRIVEEALSNVLKHASAAAVTVRLTVDSQGLQLVVFDDGVGFDPSAVAPGLGLRCLSARIEASNGRWAVESQPGGPTRLWALWAAI